MSEGATSLYVILEIEKSRKKRRIEVELKEVF